MMHIYNQSKVEEKVLKRLTGSKKSHTHEIENANLKIPISGEKSAFFNE